MTELRWILLLVGVAIVVYVYWRGRRDQRRHDRDEEPRIEPVVRTDVHLPEPETGSRREPVLGETWKPAPAAPRLRTPAPAVENAPLPSAPQEISAAATEAVDDSPGPSKIVALRIARREGRRISGAALLEVLGSEGLEYGEHRIFHRYADAPSEHGSRRAMFSVANMVEPGELNPDVTAHTDLPGITVFMVLPGAHGGVAALMDMLSSARRIAAAIDAELLDHNGSTMTRQTADHLRDEVIEFEHRQKNAHRATTVDQ